MNVSRVSGILQYDKRLVFGIQKTQKWLREGGVLRIGIVCIGAALNEGESALSGLVNEVNREIGTGFKPAPASKQLFVDSNLEVIDKPPFETDGKAFFYWQEQKKGEAAVIAVFKGKIDGEPVPSDLPGLILCDPEKLFICINRGCTFAEMASFGVDMIKNEPIPSGAVPYAVGTVRIMNELRGKNVAIAQQWLQ